MKELPKVPQFTKHYFPGMLKIKKEEGADKEALDNIANKLHDFAIIDLGKRVRHHSDAVEAARDRVKLMVDGLNVLKENDQNEGNRPLPDGISDDGKLKTVRDEVSTALSGARETETRYDEAIEEVLKGKLSDAGERQDRFVKVRAAATAADKTAAGLIEKVVAYETMASGLIKDIRVRTKVLMDDAELLKKIGKAFEKAKPMDEIANGACKDLTGAVKAFDTAVVKWSDKEKERVKLEDGQKKKPDDGQKKKLDELTKQVGELKKQLEGELEDLTDAHGRFRSGLLGIRTVGDSIIKMGTVYKKGKSKKVQAIIDKLESIYKPLFKSRQKLQDTIDGFRNRAPALPDSIKNRLPAKWDSV